MKREKEAEAFAYPIRTRVIGDEDEFEEIEERKPEKKRSRSAKLQRRINRFLERVEMTKEASGTELVDATESETYREHISHPSIGRRKSSEWVVIGMDH